MQIDRHLADRRRRQKKRRIYFFAVAGLLAVYFAALGTFIFIVRSPAFQIEKITIEGVGDDGMGGSGTNAVSSTTVMDLLEASIVRKGDLLSNGNSGFKAMLGFHSMFIWPSALPSSTIAAVPQLAGITIAKNYFFHTVTVTVTERQPFAIWCTMPSDQCYWFDNNGIAFAETADTEGGAIAVVHDYASSTPSSASSTTAAVAINEPVLPAEFVSNLISIVDAVKASGLDVQDIALTDLSLEQIDVMVANGPIIYFSLRFPVDEDLPVLQSLMAKPGFDKLRYIDFTVQNRAYYQ